MSAWKQRVDGEESPYTPLGPFKLRLPFYHYRFELPDYLQGLLMCAVDLAAIPLMMQLLGMPFEAALAIVILNGLLYLLHHLLGDSIIRKPSHGFIKGHRNAAKALDAGQLVPLHYEGQ